MRWVALPSGRFLCGLVGVLACSAERINDAAPDASWGGGAAASAGTGGELSEGGATAGTAPSAGEGGAGGAGGSSTSSADFIVSESGTRLKARVLSSDDGLQIPYDIFDSTLGAPCRPHAFADGVWRCLPDAVGGMGYADADCKERIVLSNLGAQSPMPGMLASTRDLPCIIPEDEELYLVGDELPRPETTYTFYPGQGCTGYATTEHQRAFGVTPLDLADLVGLTIDEVAIGRRLSAPIWVGEDGSRVYVERQGSHLRDVERETIVDLGVINSYDPDSPWRLVPAVQVGTPACTSEPCNFGAGIGGGGPAPSTPFFVAGTQSGCDEPQEVNHVSWWWEQGVETYRVEEKDTTIFVAGGGASPGGPTQAHGYQALERVPLEAWQEAVPFATPGRLSVNGRQVDGISVYRSPFLVDSALGDEECTIELAEDDELRCLPNGGGVVFSDDACSEPVAYDPQPPGTGGTSSGPISRPAPTFAIGRSVLPDGPQVVYRVGPPTSKPSYFKTTVDGCVPASIDGLATFEASAVEPETFGHFTLEER